MAAPFSRTEDGFESHMGISHFAPFLFTALIFKRIAAAGTKDDPARIVNISSGAHRVTSIRFDDLDFSDGKSYHKFAAYGQSKCANVLFANEIARRAKEHGVPVVAYSLHPGGWSFVLLVDLRVILTSCLLCSNRWHLFGQVYQ